MSHRQNNTDTISLTDGQHINRLQLMQLVFHSQLSTILALSSWGHPAWHHLLPNEQAATTASCQTKRRYPLGVLFCLC